MISTNQHTVTTTDATQLEWHEPELKIAAVDQVTENTAGTSNDGGGASFPN